MLAKIQNQSWCSTHNYFCNLILYQKVLEYLKHFFDNTLPYHNLKIEEYEIVEQIQGLH